MLRANEIYGEDKKNLFSVERKLCMWGMRFSSSYHSSFCLFSVIVIIIIISIYKFINNTSVKAVKNNIPSFFVRGRHGLEVDK